MSATITIDTSEFRKALGEYTKWSKRELSQIINSKAARIVYSAYNNTPRASRDEVMASNSLSINKVTINKKTGKARTRYQLDDKRRVVDLIQGRRIAGGQSPLSQADAKKQALTFATRRVNAIGTLAAGWIDSLRMLISASKERVGSYVWKRHKGRGKSEPAQPGWDPVATFSYNLQERKPGGVQIDPRCVDALQKAFNDEASSMMDYVARKMQVGADKINAK